MGSWLDRMARRAASSPSTSTPSPSTPAADDSRRSFLKKAAVVGGAAWSVPVLQTALAPAASASPGTGVGQVCTGGTGDNGKLCGDGSRCFGGICGADGATCTTYSHCMSGGCYNAVCVAAGQVGPGGSCLGSSNCQYSSGNNSSCSTHKDSPNICGGKNAYCTASSQCASGYTCNLSSFKCG